MRFAGCNTAKLALNFSAKVMRKGSRAWGTQHKINVVYFPEDDIYQLYTHGINHYTAGGGGIYSPTWIAYKGEL